MSQARRATLLVLITVVLAGCGVTPEDSARQVEPPGGTQPDWASQPSPPDATGAVPERLYLIRGDEIVPALRHVSSEPSPEDLMDDLLAGPTDSERRAGLTSALLGDEIITGVHKIDNNAVVELAAELDDTSRNDQVLAFAQIVCTLDAHPLITGVSFTSDGQPVGVPIADGSLATGPLTAAHYTALLTDG